MTKTGINVARKLCKAAIKITDRGLRWGPNADRLAFVNCARTELPAALDMLERAAELLKHDRWDDGVRGEVARRWLTEWEKSPDPTALATLPEVRP